MGALPGITNMLEHEDWWPIEAAIEVLQRLAPHTAPFRADIVGKLQHVVRKLERSDPKTSAKALEALRSYGLCPPASCIGRTRPCASSRSEARWDAMGEAR